MIDKLMYCGKQWGRVRPVTTNTIEVFCPRGADDVPRPWLLLLDPTEELKQYTQVKNYGGQRNFYRGMLRKAGYYEDVNMAHAELYRDPDWPGRTISFSVQVWRRASSGSEHA